MSDLFLWVIACLTLYFTILSLSETTLFALGLNTGCEPNKYWFLLRCVTNYRFLKLWPIKAIKVNSNQQNLPKKCQLIFSCRFFVHFFFTCWLNGKPMWVHSEDCGTERASYTHFSDLLRALWSLSTCP